MDVFNTKTKGSEKMSGRNAKAQVSPDVKRSLMRLRGEKRLSVGELSRDIGITPPTLHRIETQDDVFVQVRTYVKVTNWIARQI